MTPKASNIFKHLLAWSLLLGIQYYTTYSTARALVSDLKGFSFYPIIILSVLLISVFYFNYLYLIPRYLVTGKYVQYAAAGLCLIAAGVGFTLLAAALSGHGPNEMEVLNPVFRKIRPLGFTNLLLTMVIGFIVSVSMALGERINTIKREKLSAQLSFLKSQINPHFLFNTLNSIVVTAMDESPATADMVQKLSEMMRYTMKDAQADFVPLQDELQYISNYISLQKVRLDNSVKLSYSTSGDATHLQIAPMLMISFIENAFKYGVNPEEDSDIKIAIAIKQQALTLTVENNIVLVQADTHESNGLGIENTKHRLQLLYPDKHTLDISDDGKVFFVQLNIKLA